MSRLVCAILAYDRSEYREKTRQIREQSQKDVACLFVRSPETLQGVGVDRVITCDRFWSREDAIEIAKMVNDQVQHGYSQ